MHPSSTKVMKLRLISFFIFISFFGFAQDRVNHTYKFSVQSITTYSQAKPYYDQIRVIFSESKSVNHLLMFDSNNESFKVQSTLNFDRNSLSNELAKIGLVLREFIIDGKLEE
jgi:hypothetical protein